MKHTIMLRMYTVAKIVSKIDFCFIDRLFINRGGVGCRAPTTFLVTCGQPRVRDLGAVNEIVAGPNRECKRNVVISRCWRVAVSLREMTSMTGAHVLLPVDVCA